MALIDQGMSAAAVARAMGTSRAPELNPEEYCWTTLKYHRLSNHGHFDVGVLEEAVSHEFLSIYDDQSLLRSFVYASPLPIRLG